MIRVRGRCGRRLGLRLVDAVNHPAHYTAYPVEVIELTGSMGFLDGNVVKYVVRAPFKGDALQDYRKARFYLDRLIVREESK